MGYTVQQLAAALASAPERSYVRVVADFLARGELSDEAPLGAGDAVVDALVAAAAAQLARTRGLATPVWTLDPERVLSFFWHPGSDRFFALALAHSPAEFAVRGLFIDADSLVSV